MTVSAYAFGRFRFDANQKLLLRDGMPVPLGSRAAAILAALLAAEGRVVGKDALIEAAWSNAAIEESNLSVQIGKLRRAIGDDRIRTVERVGYQFVAAHRSIDARSGWLLGAFPSVALLSSGSFRGGWGRELLGDLSTALARFKSLRVIATPRADAGRPGYGDHGTDYVVVLSPRRRGGSGGASVRLVDRESGMVLWSEAFDAAQNGAVEHRMAASIESEVQAAEIVRGARGDGAAAEAYALYLRGRRALQSSRADDNRVAFTLFMAAIELEPDNAAYLAAATEAMHHRLAVGWEPLGADDKRVVRELAHRTLAVAGSDAVAIALAGNALFTADEEDLGLALVRRALAMNPASQLVLACGIHAESWAGSMLEAERISSRAIALAPNDPSQRFALGGMAAAALWRGDHEAALDWARQSLAFGPGYAGAHLPIIDALICLGRQEHAERLMNRYRAISPGVTIRSFEQGQHHADRSRLAPRIESLRRAGLPER